MKRSFSVKGLAACGVCIALAFVLSFVKLFSAPLGGSVTLCSMLFICIIGYFFGPKYSLTAALAYGILQFVQKPEIYTPLQVIIDYGCAFTALGLSGFFKTGNTVSRSDTWPELQEDFCSQRCPVSSSSENMPPKAGIPSYTAWPTTDHTSISRERSR